jgi:hypothetical protein
MTSRPGLRADQLGQCRRLIFLQEMFAGQPVDVVHAGGAASDLTECGDLEGGVRLPPR